MGSAVAGSVVLKACGGSSSDTSSDSSSDTGTSSGGGDVIKVGILHSLSGTMAISEKSVVDAERLAIEEINNAGGVLGKQIEEIVEDGASDWPTFNEKAKKLIDQDKVVTVFGCWTSASRKQVLPTFESKDHLLWYPVQYEGQECSKNIFYTGAAPNQQIEPSVDWLLEEFPGKPFFLVGSDYVFPRTANTIIKAQLEAKGGKSVGEDYLPLGNTEVTPIISKIKQAMPDGGVIYNTLNGDSNVAFFKQLQGAGMGPDKYPTMSVSIAEEEVQAIGVDFFFGNTDGHRGILIWPHSSPLKLLEERNVAVTIEGIVDYASIRELLLDFGDDGSDFSIPKGKIVFTDKFSAFCLQLSLDDIVGSPGKNVVRSNQKKFFAFEIL